VRCPSAITPIVIQTTAITKVGRDRKQAAMNNASGKQTVSGERFFMSFSRQHSHFDFSAYSISRSATD
jgi:hypothetical protein